MLVRPIDVICWIVDGQWRKPVLLYRFSYLLTGLTLKAIFSIHGVLQSQVVTEFQGLYDTDEVFLVFCITGVEKVRCVIRIVDWEKSYIYLSIRFRHAIGDGFAFICRDELLFGE